MKKTWGLILVIILTGCAKPTCKMKPWDLGYDKQGNPVIIRAFGDQ